MLRQTHTRRSLSLPWNAPISYVGRQPVCVCVGAGNVCVSVSMTEWDTHTPLLTNTQVNAHLIATLPEWCSVLLFPQSFRTPEHTVIYTASADCTHVEELNFLNCTNERWQRQFSKLREPKSKHNQKQNNSAVEKTSRQGSVHH